VRNVVVIIFLLRSIFLQAWHCDLITLHDIREIEPEISYQYCHHEIPFEFKKLPFERDHFLHPNKGKFTRSYIVSIPQGCVYGLEGSIIFHDYLVHDFVWQNCFVPKYLWNEILQKKKRTVFGRVAVLAQAGYTYYYHWLVEVLGRLALLEINHVEYDYLYVPYSRPYMKETLELWGIDTSKIIEASDDYIVEADRLIVPSLVATAQTDGVPRLTHYIPEYILNYVKNKLLRGYKKKKNLSSFKFAKKVFISRKDAGARKMLNEQDVFKFFEQYNFQEYVLSKMSIVEQIALFENAEIIIGSLGSGMTNVMFCNPDVKIFDIFQRRCDCTIYYMCQTLGLEYHPIKTMDFIDENDGQYDAIVPLESLDQIDSWLRN
jgi:hypothetical protein